MSLPTFELTIDTDIDTAAETMVLTFKAATDRMIVAKLEQYPDALPQD